MPTAVRSSRALLRLRGARGHGSDGTVAVVMFDRFASSGPVAARLDSSRQRLLNGHLSREAPRACGIGYCIVLQNHAKQVIREGPSLGRAPVEVPGLWPAVA